MRCRVDCEAEKVVLQVYGRAIAWEGVDEVADVDLESVEVADLGAGEAGSEEGTRVFPCWAVAGEDPVAEGGSQGCLVVGWERVVGEFEREDGFDVLWLLCYDYLRRVSLRYLA